MHTGFLLSVQVVYIQTKNTWLEVASNFFKKSGSMVDAFFILFWYPLEKLYMKYKEITQISKVKYRNVYYSL